MPDIADWTKDMLFRNDGEPSVDRRVIPNLIDHLAKYRPEAVFASIARTADIKDGFREVSYKQYGDLINQAARWLVAQIGDGNHGQTVAYIGPSDLRYVVLTIAAVKINCKMMFLSPRNTLQGQLHLLETAHCSFFATPIVKPPGIQNILRSREMKHIVVPELEDWLDLPSPPPIGYTRTFEEIRHEPMAILHSSGTTSLPKPVNYTHGCCAATWSQLEYQAKEGGQGTLIQLAGSSKRLFMGFPMFHAGGLFFPLVLSVFSGVQIVLPPPDGQPMNSSIADMMHQSGIADAACLPPSILEEIAKNPSYLAGMRNLRFVITGGAPLPKALGDAVQRSGPQICNILASTETAVIPSLQVDRDDWQYLNIPPGLGIYFRTYDEELYELIIQRGDDASPAQAVFQNYPDLQEYSTSDLFRRHSDPDKAFHWISCGRHDDVIVLLNGEKFNPIALEKELQEHAEIRSALIFGRDRVQASLLIEPSSESVHGSEKSQRNFLKSVWPAVEIANGHLPAHARLSDGLICLTSKSKPMLRTPKGSIMRNPTYEDYTQEMDKLYEAHANIKPRSRPTTPGGSDPLDVSSLTKTICQITGWLTIDTGDNFFAAGLDSWEVLQFVHEINTNMGTRVLEPATIYANPSIKQLRRAVNPQNGDSSQPKRDRNIKMSMMLESLSLNLPTSQGSFAKVAVMTGATGSFGPHLVRAICRDFDKVYCLVRKLPASVEKNVVYLTFNLAKPLLGLDFEIYRSLLKEVTHIVHNAWLVDFNLSLESFDDHLLGVRHLIDFAYRAKKKPRIFFISSIGAVIKAPASPVPEELLFDTSVCHDSGYGESKHIAELLLHRAGITSGTRSTIIRVGQIAGPVNSEGVWTSHDWLPSLITSSAKRLLRLPDSLGSAERVDWIPADILADVVNELLTNLTYVRPMTEVFHVVNPSATSWTALLPTIREHVDSLVVPLTAWIDGLEASTEAMKASDLETNPAAKLLPFYCSLAESATPLPALDVSNSLSRSATLRSLGAVRPVWMSRWLQEWGFGRIERASHQKSTSPGADAGNNNESNGKICNATATPLASLEPARRSHSSPEDASAIPLRSNGHPVRKATPELPGHSPSPVCLSTSTAAALTAP